MDISVTATRVAAPVGHHPNADGVPGDQVPYEECPEIPPELVRLPGWASFLNNVSSWTRTIVVPLSIISALKPVRELPPDRGIAELYRDDRPGPLSAPASG